MNLPEPARIDEYTSINRIRHTLHECRNAQEFNDSFEQVTGEGIVGIVDAVVEPDAPRAVFAVGSIPLGMGNSQSDVDLIVLIDGREALVVSEQRVVNNARELEFKNEADPLLAGVFLSMHGGVLIDLQVALTPAIQEVYRRLRRRGPELSETEIRTLGRLNEGWILSQSDGYLDVHPGVVGDPSLSVYCATKHFVSALHEYSKAQRAAGANDPVLVLHQGRLGVEMAYLAYFASEGMCFLGNKWPAQVGHAHSAAERLERHPLLKEGRRLLFPSYPASVEQTEKYLREAAQFIMRMRSLIEQTTLFRIAFNACPQIHAI